MKSPWQRFRDLFLQPDRNSLRELKLIEFLEDLVGRTDSLTNNATDQVVLYVDGTTGSDSYDGLSATVDSREIGPKATVNGALAVLPQYPVRDVFVKMADGTYEESLGVYLNRLRGASVHFIGGHTVEHTGTISGYTTTSLNPVGFHQLTVAGFTLEASDEGKFFLIEWDDGYYETVKILKVLSASVAEVGASLAFGKAAPDYITGSGETVAIQLVTASVTIGGDVLRALDMVGSGPAVPGPDVLFGAPIVSFTGIRFYSSQTYGTAVYLQDVDWARIVMGLVQIESDNYQGLYCASGTFFVFAYHANGYTTQAALFDTLSDGIFTRSSTREGIWIKGPSGIHIFHSPRAWLNLRSTVVDGPVYAGDWQSFTMLYPRDSGLVLKQGSNISMRLDDRSGLQIRGKVLLDGPFLVRGLSDLSVGNSDLTMEWRASTNGVPFRTEDGCRVSLGGSTLTFDNDEPAISTIEVSEAETATFDVVAITDAPTGVAAMTIEHAHVHFHGDFSAPAQDYGASPTGGILVIDGHSDVTFEGAATGQNTNVGNSDPVVLRRQSGLILPASGYNLQDGSGSTNVFLGSLGTGQAIPSSGASKNDLVANPNATEELVVISTL